MNAERRSLECGFGCRKEFAEISSKCAQTKKREERKQFVHPFYLNPASLSIFLNFFSSNPPQATRKERRFGDSDSHSAKYAHPGGFHSPMYFSIPIHPCWSWMAEPLGWVSLSLEMEIECGTPTHISHSYCNFYAYMLPFTCSCIMLSSSILLLLSTLWSFQSTRIWFFQQKSASVYSLVMKFFYLYGKLLYYSPSFYWVVVIPSI